MILSKHIEYLAYISFFVICLNNKAVAEYFMVIYYNEYNLMINLYKEDEFSKINLITQDNINVLSNFELLTQRHAELKKLNLFMRQGLQNTRIKILSYLDKAEQDNYNIELYYIVLATKHIKNNNLNANITIESNNKILYFFNYLLKKNNFSVNSKDIYLINNLDFLALTGIEAFYKTSLKKDNIHSINISILEQLAINCRVLTNRNAKKNIEFVFTNDNSYNLYQRLGEECSPLFNDFKNGLSNIHIKFKNIINTSQLGVEFNQKTQESLLDYLAMQSAEIRGFTIINYFFDKQYEKKFLLSNNINLNSQDLTEITDCIDLLQIIILSKLAKCIVENIKIMFLSMNFPKESNYSIIFGDFINNNFIRSLYFKELINQDENLSLDKIIILPALQFHISLAEATKDVVAGYDKNNNTLVLPEWNPIKFDAKKIEFLTKINQLFANILEDVF